jgi:type II secretory pathway pseudopilin PulG
MTWIRDQRGEITMTGLIVAMAILIVVLSATLGAFETFTTRSNEESERIDAEQRAHVAVERLSRDLRNLAQPQTDGVTTIERAAPYDLIFKTVTRTGAPTATNPANIVRVRYCLDSSTPGKGKLYYQRQAWTSGSSTPPTDTACPSAAPGSWSPATLLVDWVTNRAANQNRPVFTYDPPPATQPCDPTACARVRTLHADLFFDAHATYGPKETELSSGVFLRNQNRPPTALFTASPSGTSIVLNGSLSGDPEGEPLKYQFYDKSTGTPVAIPTCASVVCTWTPTPRSDHKYTIGLRVTDSGGIVADAPDQQVTL